MCIVSTLDVTGIMGGEMSANGSFLHRSSQTHLVNLSDARVTGSRTPCPLRSPSVKV